MMKLDWVNPETAVKDGRMYLLRINGGSHRTSDSDVWETIGFNNFDNDGENVWQFAGWCWTHDHWVNGSGRVIAIKEFPS